MIYSYDFANDKYFTVTFGESSDILRAKSVAIDEATGVAYIGGIALDNKGKAHTVIV